MWIRRFGEGRAAILYRYVFLKIDQFVGVKKWKTVSNACDRSKPTAVGLQIRYSRAVKKNADYQQVTFVLFAIVF